MKKRKENFDTERNKRLKEEKKLELTGELERTMEEYKEACEVNKNKKAEENKIIDHFEKLNIPLPLYPDQQELTHLIKKYGIERDQSLRILAMRDQITRKRKKGKTMQQIIKRFAHKIQSNKVIKKTKSSTKSSAIITPQIPKGSSLSDSQSDPQKIQNLVNNIKLLSKNMILPTKDPKISAIPNKKEGILFK